MSIKQIEPLTVPAVFDCATRWLVPSRSNAHEAYLVDLTGYNGNGTCQCKNFGVKREPFLRRGKSPEWALENDLPDVKVFKIKLEPGQRPADALRCFHIREVVPLYAQLNIDAEIAAEKAHSAASGH